MKIKIVSDGTARETRVVNAETGEEVENVTRVAWNCTAPERARATVEFVGVPIEAIGESDATREGHRKASDHDDFRVAPQGHTFCGVCGVKVVD